MNAIERSSTAIDLYRRKEKIGDNNQKEEKKGK